MREQAEICIARWSTGWHLARVVDHDWAQELGLQRPHMRPVFVVRDPEDQLVYELVVNDVEKTFKNDYLHVLLLEPGAPFPEAEARQICLSAIVEVLGLPILNRHLYRGPLLIPLFKDEAWFALEKEKENLPRFIDKLATIHEGQMALRKSERTELGKARQMYTNTALREFQWHLNLNRFRSPKMQEYTCHPSVAEVSKDVLKGVGIIQGTSYQIVLQLDFLPAPSWSVRVEQEYLTGEDWMTGEVLVTGAMGPAHALVQAGVVMPTSATSEKDGTTFERMEAAANAWLDATLETAPELDERFDTEPYQLLNTETPYLWPVHDFLAWVKEQPSAA